MANLKHIANSLKQYGRHGDDELVHMSKGEVGILSAIAPQGLTRNPQTGLPEAFKLGDILGPLAGLAALVFAPEILPVLGIAGGSTLGAAGLAGGASGLGTLLGGGNLKQAALSGLGGLALGSMGGLGSALGDQLGVGVGSSAASAIPSVAVTPGLQVAGTAGENALLNSAAAASASAIPAAAGAAPGVMGSLMAHPMAGMLALGAYGGAMSQPKLPVDPSAHIKTPPLVQGPVANPATQPQGYIPGFTPEQSFFNPANSYTGRWVTPQPGQFASPQGQQAQQQQPQMPMISPQMLMLAGLMNQQSQGQQSPQGMAVGGPVTPGAIDTDEAAKLRLFGSPFLAQIAPFLSPLASLFSKSYADGGAVGAQTPPQAMPIPSLNSAAGLNIHPYIGNTNPAVSPYGYSMGQLQNMPEFNPGMHGPMPPTSMPPGMPPPGQFPPGPGGKGGGIGNILQHLMNNPQGSQSQPNFQNNMVSFPGMNGMNNMMPNIPSLMNISPSFGGPQIGGFAQGGALSGPGSGLSDSINGTIDGQEPVKLASGEFVVPADVTSALGDGSTEAGAKVLHEMMNRVRTQKTGSKAQPRAVNKRVLPA